MFLKNLILATVFLWGHILLVNGASEGQVDEESCISGLFQKASPFANPVLWDLVNFKEMEQDAPSIEEFKLVNCCISSQFSRYPSLKKHLLTEGSNESLRTLRSLKNYFYDALTFLTKDREMLDMYWQSFSTLSDGAIAQAQENFNKTMEKIRSECTPPCKKQIFVDVPLEEI